MKIIQNSPEGIKKAAEILTGNGIVVGDVVEITHGGLLPRPAYHKVNTIAANTIRVEGGLPTVKSEYRLANAASTGDATLTIKAVSYTHLRAHET